jgi:hypothetical protein
MQRDIVYLGSAPAEEECAQVGDPNYPEASKVECRAFIQAIKRVCGEPPDGAVLRVKSQTHDFGQYREVCVEFDGDNQAAVEYADKCERHAPGTWAEAGMVPPVSRGLRR